MSTDLNMNGTNSVTKGTVIYEKGEAVHSVALILKGRVTIQTEGVRMVLGSGNFLGMCDVQAAIHSFTYTALDDLVLYGLPIDSPGQAALLLDEKPQYRGLLVTSLNFFIADLAKIFTKMKNEVQGLSDFVLSLYSQYKKDGEKMGLVSEQIASLERIRTQEITPFQLPDGLEYYLQCCKIPVEAQKNFFGANAYVAKQQYVGQCQLIQPMIDGCRFYSEWLFRYFRAMVMDEKNLFSLIGHMALNTKKSGMDDSELSSMLDQLMDKINTVETILIEQAGLSPNLDRERMEEVYFALLSGDTVQLDAYQEDSIAVLNDSLTQILEYAPIHMKISSDFRETMEAFLNLSDKFAKTPEATAVRKKIAEGFFEIYEAVVKKSFEDKNPPMAVQLFLRYGFVSEELLTADEMRVLMSFPEVDNSVLECKVYSMPMWLKEIYENRRNPSKDEFDMDYEESIRKAVQEGSLNKKEQESEFRNPDKRLHFEISNLMHYADRILNGNIMIFVPVLCSEALYSKLDSSVVTGAAINQYVHKIESIDYSIFCRKTLTSYEEVEISHFETADRFTPEFILFPVYGRNGIMWQDIAGRDKKTHGRILLPALFERSLEQEMMRMMAHFRWEKCRTEMGAQWNNYRYPSLTAEYTDYLQFFKKNNELSPERKAKVKAQLQQSNSRHREVFAKDYQDWILREAVGAMKLNRVAREILFTYCPFSEEIAKGLVVQNSYQEAARRYSLERHKIEKAISGAIRKFEKAGIDVPEEIERTKRLVLEL